jgi:hypothetical protein
MGFEHGVALTILSADTKLKKQYAELPIKTRLSILYVIQKANKNTNSTQVESQPRDIQHLYRQFDGYPQHKAYVSTTPGPGVPHTTHQVSKRF